METYACKKCGMSVNATCGKCRIPLKNGHITLEDGTKVQVSKCPSCEGKIKSLSLIHISEPTRPY